MTVAAGPVADRSSTWARVRAAPLETQLAVAGLVAIAFHVLDDNFFQPPPGTSAGDHVVSGLVPLVVVCAVAAAYPRLRAGARAAFALFFGILGIVIGGIEPAYYGPKVGLSGDDYTGLLALAGGVVLLGVGAVTLWRSRRRDDGLVRRYGRRALLTLAAALVVAFVLFPLSLSYGFTHAARTTTERGDLGAPYRDVAFETTDGLRLKGWFVPSENGATVIVFPGKKGTQKHARMLTRHGYGVLVFDRRGEGESEGDPNALGWAFHRDLEGALRFLRGRADVDDERIGAIGLSVGGEALLEASAKRRGFAAIVSDGAGARSVREDVVHMRASKVPEIVSSAVMTAGVTIFANQLPPPSLVDLVPKIAPTAVFLIHATKGAAGEDNNPDYFDAAGAPKQIWKIETSHTHGLTDHPQEYERRVTAFFDRTLRPTG
ncbi:MAG: alpha/beta hydrolase [Gaiellaceae bacterium]